MRIGRQVKHYEGVVLDSIEADFSPCRTYRYTLSMRFDRRGEKRAVTILKNPSSADEQKADRTIRNVESAIYRNFPEVGFLDILNIYAIRGTDAKEVNEHYRAHGREPIIGPENDRFFGEILKNCDMVVSAWGRNSGISLPEYRTRISEVRGMLQQAARPVYRMAGRGDEEMPFHATFWPGAGEFVPVKLNC